MSQPPYSFPSLRRWFVFVKNFGQYESFLAAIPANRVFATPNGSAGNANYRQLVSNDIPDLPGNKFNAGIFDVSEIPNLDASKFTSSTFNTARIPNLDASQFNSGTVSPARVPNLDTSKITSGVIVNGLTLSNFASPSNIGTTTPTDAKFDDLKFGTALGSVQINNGIGAEVVTTGVSVAYFSATEISVQLPPATNYFESFTSSTGMAGMLVVKIKNGGIPPAIIPAPGDDIDGAAFVTGGSNRGYIFFAVLATRWRLFARFL